MHTAPAQPAAPAFLATAAAAAREFESGPAGAPRRDVFTIGDDGEVVVTLPTTMSQQTYDDLKDWLDLIGRKAQRKVIAASPKAPDDLDGLIG